MIDWLIKFNDKFGKYPEIKDITANKHHCSLEINFCDGEPTNYNFKLHRRPEMYGYSKSTLKKGDEK